MHATPATFKLPLSPIFYDVFIVHGIFSYYINHNQEVVLWGQSKPDPQKGGQPQWIILRTEDYFPFKHGEQLSRIWLNRQYRILGPNGQGASWKALVKKIRGKYNREHPDFPIEKVAIQGAVWPRNTKGYYASKSNQNTQVYTWFMES